MEERERRLSEGERSEGPREFRWVPVGSGTNGTILRYGGGTGNRRGITDRVFIDEGRGTGRFLSGGEKPEERGNNSPFLVRCRASLCTCPVSTKQERKGAIILGMKREVEREVTEKGIWVARARDDGLYSFTCSPRWPPPCRGSIHKAGSGRSIVVPIRG